MPHTFVCIIILPLVVSLQYTVEGTGDTIGEQNLLSFELKFGCINAFKIIVFSKKKYEDAVD